MKPAILFTAATTSYVANCALGAGVATRTISTRNAHWVHHALYICTSTLAGAAVSSLLWSPSRAGWTLLPAAVPLALIPQISSHSRRHIVVALTASPFFVASLIKAWR
jgi:ABC-type spermidine/putrescine transport system permease subunit I